MPVRLRRARSPPPPSAPPRPGRPRPAASSARQRSYIGQISSSRSADSAHSSSSRARRLPVARRAARARTGAGAAARTRRLAALVGERQQPAPGRPRRVDLAAPDEPLTRDPLGRIGDVGAAVRGHAAEALAQVVDRPPAQAARPAERVAARAARPRGPARALPRSASSAHASASRIRSTRLAAVVDRHLRQHVRAQRRVAPALGQRALEVRLELVDALRRRRPRRAAASARTRSAPGGSESSSGVEQLGHALPLARDARGSRPSASRRSLPLGRSGRRQPQRVLGQLDGLRRGAARGRAGRGRGDRGRERPRRDAPSRARGGRRAAPRRRPRSASARWSSRRSRARERFLAAAASSGCDGAHAVAVDDQQAGVDGVLERARVRRSRASSRSRRSPLSATASSSPADRVRQPRHARAEQVLDRVRHRHVLARSPAARARPARGRPRARTAGCRASCRRCGAAAAAAGSARAARTAGAGSRRGSAGRPRGAPAPPRSSACSSAERPAGAPGEQERDRLALEPARGERERVGGRRVEPLDVVDRDEQRRRGGERAQRVQERRARSRAAPAARRSARPAAARPRARARCGAGSAGELLRVDPVAAGRSAPRTTAAPRRRSAAPRARAARARARAVDPRLPQRRLADPRPAGEHERAAARPRPRGSRGAPRAPSHGRRSGIARQAHDHSQTRQRPSAAPG